MGLVTVIQSHQERKRIEIFKKRNKLGGLEPGDIVAVKDTDLQLRYRGRDYCTTIPGWEDYGRPFFGSAHPRDGHKIYYLRQGQESVGESPGGIVHLDASIQDLRKIGHITPDEWRAMEQELRTG